MPIGRANIWDSKASHCRDSDKRAKIAGMTSMRDLPC
jgi:hypothetical protein